jgi:hypothetical protein
VQLGPQLAALQQRLGSAGAPCALQFVSLSGEGWPAQPWAALPFHAAIGRQCLPFPRAHSDLAATAVISR